MSTRTRTPAQAAGAGARGGAPASPPSKAIAARRAVAGVFNPKIHCGAAGRQKKRRCMQRKGFRTDHPGSGRCWLHGGRTPTGRAAAAKEQAARALERLGQPVGSGSPLQLLEKAVRYADGNLEASAALLVEIVAEQKPDTPPDRLVIDAAREIFTQAIRLAGRVGKEAADAHIAERRATIDEMIVGLLERVLLAGLDELGVSPDQRDIALARMHRELVAVLPEPADLN